VRPNNLDPVNMSHFTYLREKNLLVTEISDLPKGAIARLYPDACDVGLAVRSPRSGQVVTFAQARVLRHPSGHVEEGDLIGWVFEPVGRIPAHIAALRIHVFND